jgi:LysR family transcriptional regulator, hydrogen peroxide-inducible genes activator
MNIRDLQYLVAVAELQHFGRAAERCHVSQPTLSMQIRKLEDFLGVPLFERTGRKVMVSAAGEQIVERARMLIRDYEELQSVARRLKDPSAGQYRLGVFPTLAPYFLPRIVPAIHAEFPRLRLILLEEKTDVLLARLRRGQIDMALLALPVAGEDLHAMPLFDEPFCLAVSERHPLAARRGIDAAELEGQTLLLLDEGHCLRDQALEFCKMNAIEESREFRATSLETLIQMVATDMGATLVPEMATRDAPRHLRFIPFHEPGPYRRIGLVWRRKASQQGFFERLGNLMKRFRDGASR